MTAGPFTAIADEAMSNISGTRDAQRLLHTIREGCAPADALLEAAQQVQATGNKARTRGFFREIAKVLERT